ncbi:MAG: biopolymer transporter ExbD [Phycisphaerae bacterium]|nr:biopolymer transporter ExbD [Phycisphaerae bacterium]
MARSVAFRTGGSGDLQFNMTPMIDVTFQLIIFFILAGQMSSQEMARTIKLSRPAGSQALKDGPEQALNRVVVNVVSRAALVREGQSLDPSLRGMASHYEIMGKAIDVGNTSELLGKLKEFKDSAKAKGQKEEDFTVEIRADYRVDYGQVEPVLAAAVEAKIPKMNIAALLAGGE